MSAVTFGLAAVGLHGATGDGLPPDLTEIIGGAGDRHRDDFTRLCLYLALSERPPAGQTDVTVVIGTEYGNTDMLAGLQRQAQEKGRLLSAQVFPQATSSSAAAFVAIGMGATGRNMTLNGGVLTPVVALWQALQPLRSGQSTRSHLLVGDVYSEEARQDVALQDPGAICRSGIAQGVLTEGDEFTAEFDFTPSAPGTVPPERNGAFATADFLRALRDLPEGERVTLRRVAPRGRTATATITRTACGRNS